MTPNSQPPTDPETPCGLNHIVLNVRDIDEAHRFWTECLGFRHVGTSRRGPDVTPNRAMRFYSGELDGKLRHHDIALVERTGLPWDAPKRSTTLPSRTPHTTPGSARSASSRRGALRCIGASIAASPTAFTSTIRTATRSNWCTNCRARPGKVTSKPH